MNTNLLLSRMMRLAAFVLLALLMPQVASAQLSLYGDVNGDGVVNVSDVNAVISVIIDGHTQTTDGHECVDLGLPSGTLWATMNVGAGNPEDYGDYFAWGETTPKAFYGWGTYRWSGGSAGTLSKYNTASGYGAVDDIIELEPADDAATVNWGPSWRMPTIDQMDELIAECIWRWTSSNGVNGYMVTSKHNGNSLFLPAAGCRYEGKPYGAGEDGAYWSRKLYAQDPVGACYMIIHAGYVHYSGYYDRIYGQSVRPVRASRQ